MKQIKLGFLSCARPELVEGYLRAFFSKFLIVSNISKLLRCARGNPSTRPSLKLRRAGGCLLLSLVGGSGRAQKKHILSHWLSDLYYMLLVMIFCISICIHAKQTGDAGATPAQRPEPYFAKATKGTPAAQAPTFYTLITYVKSTPSVWDRTNARLNTNFINDMIQKARGAQLDGQQLETILQTARDVHGIFSGNPQQDIAILQSVDNQIAAAIK